MANESVAVNSYADGAAVEALKMLRESIEFLRENRLKIGGDLERQKADAERYAGSAISALAQIANFQPAVSPFASLGFKLPKNLGKLLENQINDLTEGDKWRGGGDEEEPTT